MIRSFSVHDPKRMQPDWYGKVEALSHPRIFEFKPGLNVVFGDNGSGKSTLLKAMARLFSCQQGGQPTITRESVRAVEEYRFKTIDDAHAVFAIDHDGQPVRYNDPSEAIGLLGGMAAFDGDFMSEGVESVMFRGSAGQTTLQRGDTVLRQMMFGEIPDLKWRVKAESTPEWYRAFLKGHGKQGQATVLMDESERSYDLDKQMRHWHLLRSAASEIQIIVASHSMFALELPEAHYIELVPGALKKARDLYLWTAAGMWAKQKIEPIASKRKKFGAR